MARLLPVLDALADCGVPLSVDTYKPEVMRAALAHGAAMINDIYALRMPGAIAAVAASNCAVCLMHMQGAPLTMQNSPAYDDVFVEVRDFLAARAAAATDAGISRDRLLIDPGFGFGKTLEHNLELLRRLGELAGGSLPLLAGISRKAMLGAITGRPVERSPGGQRRRGAACRAARRAHPARARRMGATRDALAVWRAAACA